MDKRKWPKPIESEGLRGAAREVLQSESTKRLLRLLGIKIVKGTV